MSRSEYRKLFTAQGSAPLTNLHMLAPQRVQTDYDSQCRSNVVIMSGDAAQSKIHIPKVDPKARTPAAPLSAHSFLLLQACLTNQDFSCDVDLTTSFSASVSGGAPQLKKVGLRVSIGTFHGGDTEGAKGAGGRAGGYRSVAVVGPRSETQQKGAPCRLPLLMHRGVWHTVVIDLEAIVCSHVESCDAFRDLVSPPDSARRAGKPRHLNIVLTGLLIDSLTLSGSCRFKEISTASDETAAMMLIRETRLPRHLIPEHALHGFDVQTQASPQAGERSARGVNQPSSPGPASNRPMVATPEPSPASSPIKSPGVNVRFSKNAEGKVAFVAQDVAKEKREEEKQEQAVVQEASWEEFKKQEEALKSLVAREREDNDYTRLVEPPSAEPTDRFGVRLPPKPAPQPERLDRTFNFDGWESSDPPKTAPVENQPPAGRGRGSAATGASTARGRAAASTAARTTTPPPRGRGGRVQAPPPPRPVAIPTPSSLLLTSVMKRPLEPTHPADNLILMSDEMSGKPSNSAVVLGHRRVGFGVGCLDIIHSSSEGDDSDDSEDSDSDV